MLNAIEAEIRAASTETKYGSEIQTIYFGGGTPSILEQEELQMLMDGVRAFNIDEDAEITLEANPDDISPAKLDMWKQAGINRLSVGIQSFFENELQWMNRAHNAKQALQCLEDISLAGLTNFSADLIYGSPLLSDEKLIHNLEVLVQHKVPHISCYALTVEPKTALDHKIKKHLSPGVSSARQSNQFIIVMNFLRNAGYEHYEISNFALPGFRSRHNSSYWKGLPYYGFGPSAHSFNGNDIREWNVSNNALYTKSIVENEVSTVKEQLTDSEKWNEFVMISIRTSEGISLEKMEKDFGEKQTKKFLAEVSPWVMGGKMIKNEGRIFLTDEGKLFADGIASSLFA